MGKVEIKFRVSGTPKGQPRPRAWARKMAGGQVVARMYDAGTAEAWKGSIAFFAGPSLPTAPLDGPIRVSIDFLFPRPAYLNRKKSPDGEIRHTAKPDRDNLDKCVLDVLKSLGFFHDDAQVCAGEIRKFYISKSGVAGARVTIETLHDSETSDGANAAPQQLSLIGETV